MIDIFGMLCSLAKEIGGNVTSANFYESGFMTVNGRTYDGKSFTLSLVIKEEEKNA